MCKVSDKSEMVGEIIGWFHMELPHCANCEEYWKYLHSFTIFHGVVSQEVLRYSHMFSRYRDLKSHEFSHMKREIVQNGNQFSRINSVSLCYYFTKRSRILFVEVSMRNIGVSIYSFRTHKKKFSINRGNANIFNSKCNFQLNLCDCFPQNLSFNRPATTYLCSVHHAIRVYAADI